MSAADDARRFDVTDTTVGAAFGFYGGLLGLLGAVGVGAPWAIALAAGLVATVIATGVWARQVHVISAARDRRTDL